MANQDPLPLPIDIPWQPLCVSNDMIDSTACNKKFPMPWKTSIAISGYEPDESLMPQPFCGGKLTYLKVTVTIAGYQPTDEEIKKGYTTFIMKTKLDYKQAVEQRRLIGLQIKN